MDKDLDDELLEDIEALEAASQNDENEGKMKSDENIPHEGKETPQSDPDQLKMDFSEAEKAEITDNCANLLLTLSKDRDSVQTMRTWVQEHKAHMDVIRQMFVEHSMSFGLDYSARLGLFFCIHDIFMKVKADFSCWTDDLTIIVPRCVHGQDKKYKKTVDKVFEIWEQKKIVKTEYLDHWKAEYGKDIEEEDGSRPLPPVWDIGSKLMAAVSPRSPPSDSTGTQASPQDSAAHDVLDGTNLESLVAEKNHLTLRIDGCAVLRALLKELRLPTTTRLTAFHLFHNHLERHKGKFIPEAMPAIVIACVFLAGKIEDTPPKLDRILQASQVLLDKKDIKNASPSPPKIPPPGAPVMVPDSQDKAKKAGEADGMCTREEALEAEQDLLLTCEFNFHFNHPHLVVPQLLEDLKLNISFGKQVYEIFSEPTYTTSILCLHNSPHDIALAALVLTSKIHKFELPQDWPIQVHANVDQLLGMIATMMDCKEAVKRRDATRDSGGLMGFPSDLHLPVSLDSPFSSVYRPSSPYGNPYKGSRKLPERAKAARKHPRSPNWVEIDGNKKKGLPPKAPLAPKVKVEDGPQIKKELGVSYEAEELADVQKKDFDEMDDQKDPDIIMEGGMESNYEDPQSVPLDPSEGGKSHEEFHPQEQKPPVIVPPQPLVAPPDPHIHLTHFLSAPSNQLDPPPGPQIMPINEPASQPAVPHPPPPFAQQPAQLQNNQLQRSEVCQIEASPSANFQNQQMPVPFSIQNSEKSPKFQYPPPSNSTATSQFIPPPPPQKQKLPEPQESKISPPQPVPNAPSHLVPPPPPPPPPTHIPTQMQSDIENNAPSVQSIPTEEILNPDTQVPLQNHTIPPNYPERPYPNFSIQPTPNLQPPPPPRLPPHPSLQHFSRNLSDEDKSPQSLTNQPPILETTMKTISENQIVLPTTAQEFKPSFQQPSTLCTIDSNGKSETNIPQHIESTDEEKKTTPVSQRKPQVVDFDLDELPPPPDDPSPSEHDEDDSFMELKPDLPISDEIDVPSSPKKEEQAFISLDRNTSEDTKSSCLAAGAASPESDLDEIDALLDSHLEDSGKQKNEHDLNDGTQKSEHDLDELDALLDSHLEDNGKEADPDKKIEDKQESKFSSEHHEADSRLAKSALKKEKLRGDEEEESILRDFNEVLNNKAFKLAGLLSEKRPKKGKTKETSEVFSSPSPPRADSDAKNSMVKKKDRHRSTSQGAHRNSRGSSSSSSISQSPDRRKSLLRDRYEGSKGHSRRASSGHSKTSPSRRYTDKERNRRRDKDTHKSRGRSDRERDRGRDRDHSSRELGSSKRDHGMRRVGESSRDSNSRRADSWWGSSLERHGEERDRHRGRHKAGFGREDEDYSYVRRSKYHHDDHRYDEIGSTRKSGERKARREDSRKKRHSRSTKHVKRTRSRSVSSSVHSVASKSRSASPKNQENRTTALKLNSSPVKFAHGHPKSEEVERDSKQTHAEPEECTKEADDLIRSDKARVARTVSLEEISFKEKHSSDLSNPKHGLQGSQALSDQKEAPPNKTSSQEEHLANCFGNETQPESQFETKSEPPKQIKPADLEEVSLPKKEGNAEKNVIGTEKNEKSFQPLEHGEEFELSNSHNHSPGKDRKNLAKSPEKSTKKKKKKEKKGHKHRRYRSKKDGDSQDHKGSPHQRKVGKEFSQDSTNEASKSHYRYDDRSKESLPRNKKRERSSDKFYRHHSAEDDLKTDKRRRAVSSPSPTRLRTVNSRKYQKVSESKINSNADNASSGLESGEEMERWNPEMQEPRVYIYQGSPDTGRDHYYSR